MPTLDERLVEARAAKREQERVAERLAEARADRAKLDAQLAIAVELVASEAGDVERLEGVGGFFRRLVTSREDLTREQKELASAKLREEGLLEEQRAIDVDIAQLEERAARVRDAESQYTAILAELEAKAGTDGVGGPQLKAIAETEGRLRAARREVEEAVAAGRAAFDVLTVANDAVTQSIAARDGSNNNTSLLGMLGANQMSQIAADLSEHTVHEQLRAQISAAQHALATFHRECRDVDPRAMMGLEVTQLPSALAMIITDLGTWKLGQNQGSTAGMLAGDLLIPKTVVDFAGIGSQLAMASTFVASETMSLRGRGEQLDQAIAALAQQRAALLDPQRDRL